MKLAAIASGLILGASMLLASSAMADSGKLDLFEKVQVGTQKLKPGNYKVEWSGTGNNVELQITRDGNIIASTPATIRTGNREESDGYTTKTRKDGTIALQEIFFSGKNWTLELQPAHSPMGKSGS